MSWCYNESPSTPACRWTTWRRRATWWAGWPPGPCAASRWSPDPLAASDRARRRLRGARACARELGLPPPAHLCMPLHTAADAGVLRQALRARPAPTALFCSNDLLAASVIAELRGLGVRVPEDLSVCGFDGMHFAALMVPPLTTVEQPSRDIGARACAQLLARLRGESAVAPAPAASIDHGPHRRGRFSRSFRTRNAEMPQLLNKALRACRPGPGPDGRGRAGAEMPSATTARPEWADWSTALKAIKEKTGIQVPGDNKNSGQALASMARRTRQSRGRCGLPGRDLRHPGRAGQARARLQAARTGTTFPPA